MGLLHNLGILILAITFPEEFTSVFNSEYQNKAELLRKEEEVIGWNHAKVGAYYLWNHHISEDIVESVNFTMNLVLPKLVQSCVQQLIFLTNW